MLTKLPKLAKPSPADVILIMVLVVLGAVTLITWQSNADSEQMKATLDLRLRAAESSLSEPDKRATLESLRQRLEQLRSAPTESLLIAKTEAVAATDKILSYAQSNSVSISGWDSGYISTTVAQKKFSAIRHNLVVEAETNGLIGFVEALTEVSAATAIQNVKIDGVKEKENRWQMNFELLLYYR